MFKGQLVTLRKGVVVTFMDEELEGPGGILRFWTDKG